MRNVILGSGIIGLLAKKILGPSWDIVPFYASRFFSFNPALDDNFITRDKAIDDFIRDITGKPAIPVLYKRAWSIRGQLLGEFDNSLCNEWLWKIHDGKVPSHAQVYNSTRMSMMVYNDVRTNLLYKELLDRDKQLILAEKDKGQITEIGDHYFIRNGQTEEFDNIVSTIPLDALCNLMHVKGLDLQAKTIHYLHVATDDLDFEGNNQTLVVDSMFDFFKVTCIAPSRYLFYFQNEVQNPGAYLMKIIRSFDIIDGTSISNAICSGEIPDLSWLEKLGIVCVGSSAQWDSCADVGSCILRLMRFAERGFKPAKNKHVNL